MIQAKISRLGLRSCMSGLFLNWKGISSPPGVSIKPSVVPFGTEESLNPAAAEDPSRLLDDKGGRDMNVGAEFILGLLCLLVFVIDVLLNEEVEGVFAGKVVLEELFPDVGSGMNSK